MNTIHIGKSGNVSLTKGGGGARRRRFCLYGRRSIRHVTLSFTGTSFGGDEKADRKSQTTAIHIQQINSNGRGI